MHQIGAIDNRSIEKYKKESAEIGKPSFHFAWVFDRLKSERERGLTIMYHLWCNRVNNMTFGFVDTPGHRCFIKNCLRGLMLADYPVLLVCANENEFLMSVDDGTKTNLQDRLLLLYAYGFREIIVAVNKMDLAR